MQGIGLRGAVVLVTGAGSGIGWATAKAFALAGARVIAADINERGLERLLRETWAREGDVDSVVLDVTDAAAFAQLAVRLSAEGRLPSILVNNAGVCHLSSVFDTTPETLRRVMEVNLMGVLNACSAFGPRMVAAGTPGRIVNVAALAAVAPPPYMSAFAASKAGVVAISEALAQELAATCVGVCCIFPGEVSTPLVRTRQAVGRGMSNAHVDRVQDYYQRAGSHPDVVARSILSSLREGRSSAYPGRRAGLVSLMQRVLPSGAFRSFNRHFAREAGYLA